MKTWRVMSRRVAPIATDIATDFLVNLLDSEDPSTSSSTQGPAECSAGVRIRMSGM